MIEEYISSAKVRLSRKFGDKSKAANELLKAIDLLKEELANKDEEIKSLKAANKPAAKKPAAKKPAAKKPAAKKPAAKKPAAKKASKK